MPLNDFVCPGHSLHVSVWQLTAELARKFLHRINGDSTTLHKPMLYAREQNTSSETASEFPRWRESFAIRKIDAAAPRNFLAFSERLLPQFRLRRIVHRYEARYTPLEFEFLY